MNTKNQLPENWVVNIEKEQMAKDLVKWADLRNLK